MSNFGFLLGFSLVLEKVERTKQATNIKRLFPIFGGEHSGLPRTVSKAPATSMPL